MKKKSLVIVESPAKAKTISKFLGAEYEVVSSMGHLIDLPLSKMGVDIKNNFKPEYVVVKGRKKILSEIKSAAKDKSNIFLATDPDREGEAISWHLHNELKDKNNRTVRVEFHQITKDAVEGAFASPRDIDINKVNAQQARRILDRIVGYSISPILWKKISHGLSAGRVQSVAVRLIVEREDAIKAFIQKEYWEIEAQLKKKADAEKDSFKAKLEKISDKKTDVPDKNGADDIVSRLKNCIFTVTAVKESRKVRLPPAPYTTSKLQQDAYNKLRFPAEKTMRIAQQLYEGLEMSDEGMSGLITYMRTDSVNIAKSAQDEAASYVKKEFGDNYLPKVPNKFKSKRRTQDAHEAIRPTSVYKTPEKIRKFLTAEQHKLYTLIWQRFLQSQMKPALFNAQSVEIAAAPKENKGEGAYLFKSTGMQVAFEGFMAVVAQNDKADYIKLPLLSKGEELDLMELFPSQHFTKPPARYTDASLVKDLEEKGIGRPSTYAPIIYTILKRQYVKREEGSFSPTALGSMVNEMLVKFFPHILDVEFTAKMEDELDKVEEGEMNWQDALNDFYKPFSAKLSLAQQNMEKIKGKEQKTDYICQQCKRPMVVKWSRRGRFLSCSGFPKCKNAKPIKENPDGTFEVLEDEKTDKVCDKCGKPMVIKRSRHGRFLSCSGYPKCRNAKAIPTGVKCPQENCGGELLERYSRGRIFYGCSNYPNCKYTAAKLPDKV
ncbi:MAG: type I DNA topoisomerase [Candidatus Omnitrophica bacterium]|nr:type I DNA topoisomerase [Candidatus Omnitrophota bacterium]